MPPYPCGVGDYSARLADAIRSTGEDVVIVTGRGNQNEHVHVVEYGLGCQGLQKLFQKLEFINVDHLILQFTPLTYKDMGVACFWKRCSLRWRTSVIVHETYFRTWWHPKSWINGLREKRLLKNIVTHSHFVFSASQPLVSEMKGWKVNENIQLLPIGSNFSLVAINRELTRDEFGIDDDEIVLVLFGGGNSLKWMKRYVYATDALLYAEGVKARWLLLGGIPESWFKLGLHVISPGRLSEQQISTWLQASDIFLMPHYAGLCAKRGTLMAAMQHTLPVVGTRAKMTDQFWEEVEGVCLTSSYFSGGFSRRVLALSLDRELRERLGSVNQVYFQKHFMWKHIARRFLEAVH